VNWGNTMSESNDDKRMGFFGFLAQLIHLLRLALYLFFLGPFVIIFSEIYFRASSTPNPDWLAGLERFYVSAWRVIQAIMERVKRHIIINAALARRDGA
jgi:hypothetical protein